MVSEKLNAGISLMDVDTAELLKTEGPALSLLNPEEGTSKPSLLDTVQSSLAQDLVDFPDDIPLSGHSSAEETISADETLPNSQTSVDEITDEVSKSEKENIESTKANHPKEITLEEMVIIDMGGMDVVEEVLQSEGKSVGNALAVEAKEKVGRISNVENVLMPSAKLPEDVVETSEIKLAIEHSTSTVAMESQGVKEIS